MITLNVELICILFPVHFSALKRDIALNSCNIRICLDSFTTIDTCATKYNDVIGCSKNILYM